MGVDLAPSNRSSSYSQLLLCSSLSDSESLLGILVVSDDEDPIKCYWDVAQMWEHLAISVESGTMTSFPRTRLRQQPVGRLFK